MKDQIVRLPIGDASPEARLIYGVDVRSGLRLLASDSIHCVTTSPPYWGLRDYQTAPSVWGGDSNCDHKWVVGTMTRKGSSNGRAELGSTLMSAGSRKTLAPGVTNDHGDELGQYRDDEYATCTACSAWRGQLGHEPDPDAYVEHLVEVFREVRRVLRADGTAWLNLGDTFCSQGGPRTYGSFDGVVGRASAPRTRTGSWSRHHPSPEPDKRPGSPSLKTKDLVGIPWRVALALQADGWWLRNDIIWQKANHMPSPVRDRLASAHEHIFLLTKSSRYYFDLDAIRVPHRSGTYDADGDFTPSQNWFELNAGSRKLDQTEGQLGTHAGPPRRFGRGLFHPSGKNPGDCWDASEDPYTSTRADIRVIELEERVRVLEDQIRAYESPPDILMLPTQPFPGSHFAVWPQAIPERCIRAGTSEHGCCASCGAPWQRVVDREDAQGNSTPSGGRKAISSQEVREAGGIGRLDGGRRAVTGSTFHNNPRKRALPDRTTRGWAPTCACGTGVVRCKVLDPFSGSGTTGRVSLRLGRDYVGLDLNESYLPMAVARVRDEAPPDPQKAPDAGSILDLFDVGM